MHASFEKNDATSSSLVLSDNFEAEICQTFIHRRNDRAILRTVLGKIEQLL